MIWIAAICWWAIGYGALLWDDVYNYKVDRDWAHWLVFRPLCVIGGIFGPFTFVIVWLCAQETLFDNIRTRQHPWRMKQPYLTDKGK